MKPIFQLSNVPGRAAVDLATVVRGIGGIAFTRGAFKSMLSCTDADAKVFVQGNP
jgi:hypothetical protein